MMDKKNRYKQRYIDSKIDRQKEGWVDKQKKYKKIEKNRFIGRYRYNSSKSNTLRSVKQKLFWTNRFI